VCVPVSMITAKAISRILLKFGSCDWAYGGNNRLTFGGDPIPSARKIILSYLIISYNYCKLTNFFKFLLTLTALVFSQFCEIVIRIITPAPLYLHDTWRYINSIIIISSLQL